MFKQIIVVSLLVSIEPISSQARPFRTSRPPECNVTMPCDFSYSLPGAARLSRSSYGLHVLERRPFDRLAMSAGRVDVPVARIVGGRPAGCPQSFCGCGAAMRVFGRIVPELNLAANWLRFPRTSPAPGMVAARHGHVFVLEQHIGGDIWLAYDANSGGHATRIHARSLRGYTVVNPHAA
nr:hypothetical protein [Bradyrhizobium sp. CCBAU 51745]